MNKITRKIAFILSALIIPAVVSAENVESLRGEAAIDAQANEAISHKINIQQGGYERNFEKQPPLIPHEVHKYRITLKNNGCLNCHSEKAYQKERAPKVGDSHYFNRQGEKLETISSNRYFCLQCHVTQVTDRPLVRNEFLGAE